MGKCVFVFVCVIVTKNNYLVVNTSLERSSLLVGILRELTRENLESGESLDLKKKKEKKKKKRRKKKEKKKK